MDYDEAMRELSGEAETDAFSLGVEEEYFLIDPATGSVVQSAPESLFTEANAGTEGRVEHEFLQCQAETVTRPCTSLAQIRDELRFARGVLSEVAERHGLAIVAAGTHPTAQWRGAVYSDHERYDRVMGELQMIGERNMLCGMHVHVSLPDPGRRVDVMRRILPFLPLFVALAAGSPFWASRATGLKGYRLAAYDELPRTGLPELFRDTGEFEAYCASLVAAGAMPDASHLWWAIRPSHKFPTLELRAPDSCARLEDALGIAALYRALVRHLYLDPGCNGGIGAVDRALAVENKWRAQRYGVQGSFATRDGPSTVADCLEAAIALTAEDAEKLGCAGEIAHLRRIVAEGSSADRQLALYRENAEADGVEGALRKVIAWLAATTREVR